MQVSELVETLARLTADAGFADDVDVLAGTDDATMKVSAPSPRPILELLAGAGFDYLVFVTAVDWPDRMTLVYRLGHMRWKVQVFVECDIDRADPKAASVADLWPTADWHERETYDLMGVSFEGHPDLRRLILPEDWEGHPLRKDYVDSSIERRPDYI